MEHDLFNRMKEALGQQTLENDRTREFLSIFRVHVTITERLLWTFRGHLDVRR